MRIKRFQAGSIVDALDAVKREMGTEAVILETRPVRSWGWKFWRAGRGVEVTAASGWSFSRLSETSKTGSMLPEGEETRAGRQGGALDSLRPLLNDLLATAGPNLSLPLFPERIERVYDRLLQQGVEEGLARLCSMHLSEHPEQAPAAYLRSLLGPPIPVRRLAGRGGGARRVVIVGPTGVGKTTTLAKLAAEFTLKQRWRVALIGADTYRMAATEQLARYAKIMSLPFYVARNPQELRLHLDALRDTDLVLIDTAGRSHRNAERVAELRQWLAAAAAHELHLCISLTMPYREAVSVLRVYQPLGVDRLLLTKRDEVEGIGLALNLGVASGLPLSYLTDGQRVPEDIRPADPDWIVRELLGEERSAGEVAAHA